MTVVCSRLRRPLARLTLSLSSLLLVIAFVACGPSRGSNSGSDKCEGDDDCKRSEYCDVDEGDTKGRCRAVADNNGTNNIGINNGGINNGGTNNGGTNNGGTNNGGTNNGSTNNGSTNNGGTNNGGTNNGDEIEVCQTACVDVTSCSEFVELCGAVVTAEALSDCLQLCEDDAPARAQITAAGSLSCGTGVRLTIDSFGLHDICNGGGTNNGGLSYRFVLLEDLSSDDIDGDSPGADIDAVAIEKNGVEYFASNIEDFAVSGANNGYTDTFELLGAPDSACTRVNFTALGGAVNGGYVVVSFEDDATFGSGDLVIVYELGPTLCPSQPNWFDDGIRVSVSTHLDNFEILGEVGPGQNVLEIP